MKIFTQTFKIFTLATALLGMSAGVMGQVNLPFAFDGGKADLSSAGFTVTGSLGSDYSSSPKLKFSTTANAITLQFNEDPGKLSYSIKWNKGTSSTFTGTFNVFESIDGSQWTIVKTYTASTFSSATSFNEEMEIKNTSRYLKWEYTTKNSDSGNIAIGKIQLLQKNSQPIIIEATTINSLRSMYTETPAPNTFYKLTGEAIVTFEYTKNRGQYYIQDATGAILIDDATGKLTTSFTAGDGITNLQGTFSTYGVLQFVPTENATKTTSGNVVTPKLITPTQLATGDYESQLVKIDGITVEGTGKFVAKTNYTLANETFQIRTFDLTYDAEINAVKNIIGIAGKFTTGTPATTTYQIYPRSDADLINVPTAIETPTLAEGSIFISNGQIVVKAETAGALIQVYNIGGQRLVSQVAEAGRNTFTLAKGQIYVVKVGNLVKKVVL
ncbi:MAG: hypothetical protein ACWA6U_02435 [Breznakibacter sp.]